MAFDNPHGFTLLTPMNQVMTWKFIIDTSETVYIGDVVKPTAAVGGVEQYDAGDALFAGVSLEYGAQDAGGAVEVLVCIDASALYRVQTENGGDTIAAEDVFEGFDVASSPGTPAGLTSAQELKDEPLANQANAPFILVGLDKGAEASGGKKPTFGVALTEAIVRPNSYNLVWHLDA